MNAKPFTPSPAQQRYFDWITNGTGSVVLEAVAGAGKTTTIINGLRHMQGQVIFLAYNSAAAADLYARIPTDRRGAFAKTFHSVGVNALRYAYGKTHALTVDGGKVQKITKALLLERSELELLDLTGAVAAFVSMAKQRGIGALTRIDDDNAWLAMVDHFALDDSLPDGFEGHVLTTIHLAHEVLKRSNADLETIDFDDMVYLPLQRRLRLLQHDWVVIDEAQDTNPTRRALAAALLRPNGRLVAVGDRAQAIYGFTGTDNDSLEQLEEAFACERLPLTVSYRCPKAVVAVARKYANHIEAAETALEGYVGHYGFENVVGAVEVGDAVLCRFNKYLVALAFKLIRSGVPAKIEGRDVGNGLVKLATRWKRIKTLTALEDKLSDWLDAERAKAKLKDDARRAQDAEDRVETLRVLTDRTREQGGDTVEALVAVIGDLFEDKAGEAAPCVVLCSGHKSKGREWDRVHLLGLEELQPARTSRDWQAKQEINLMYVMATRAKRELFIVNNVKEPK
jgi:superfamily I DNA/RNA helicase